MWMHGKQTDRIAELERENAELRRELMEQWWENHVEHCDTEWPHVGTRCDWPLPPGLQNRGDTTGLFDHVIKGSGPLPKGDDAR
jgi:hypothetical protein